MMFWYRSAIVCGVLLLLAGTITFGTWLATDLEELVFLGIYVFLGGLAFVVIGFIALARYAARARKAASPHKKSAAVAAAIILLNFPIAFVYTAIASNMMTTTFVTIENRFPNSIRNLILTDPRGQVFYVEEIRAGYVHAACYAFSGEGEVAYSMTVGSDAQSGTLIGYLTSGIGMRVMLRVAEDGQVETSEIYATSFSAELLRRCAFQRIKGSRP